MRLLCAAKVARRVGVATEGQGRGRQRALADLLCAEAYHIGGLGSCRARLTYEVRAITMEATAGERACCWTDNHLTPCTLRGRSEEVLYLAICAICLF